MRVFLLICALLFFVKSFSVVSNYEILENSRFFVAIKINPRAYSPKIFYKVPSRGSEFYINSNFFWKEYPVGWIKDVQSLISWSNTLSPTRPVLLFDKNGLPVITTISNSMELEQYGVATQAGPWLIKNFEIIYLQSLKDGNFLKDVARPAAHTSIGITNAGKLILVYSSYTSLELLSRKMLNNYKCRDAFNCDGGSSSALKIKNEKYGNKSPKYGVEFFLR